ncbi:MAG TPA: glycosyltransferase [Bacteroidota bacterium]
MKKQLVYCEPHCHDVEHAQYNAALLLMGTLAFPADRVIFIGEEEHCHWVRMSLAAANSTVAERVDWRFIQLVRNETPYFRGTKKRISLYRLPLSVADHMPSRAVVYCSTAIKGLMILKVLMHLRDPRCPVLALFHNQLPRLLPYSHSLFSPNQLRVMFSIPSPSSLKFVALGKPIYDYLIHLDRKLDRQFVYFDLPRIKETARSDASPRNEIAFGFFGVTLNKGFERFLSFSRVLKKEFPDVRFALIGYVNHPLESQENVAQIENLSTRPMSPGQYASVANGVCYAVGLANPDDYRLRASAAFLDALAFGKPGIYLRNPYIEHYFERFGDIGYLCNSTDEVEDTAREICRSFPRERYHVQMTNCVRAANTLTPEMIATDFRTIVSNLTRPHNAEVESQRQS